MGPDREEARLARGLLGEFVMNDNVNPKDFWAMVELGTQTAPQPSQGLQARIEQWLAKRAREKRSRKETRQ
jgi:hypothetical protein